MLMRIVFTQLLSILFLAGSALAQSSDISILAGAYTPGFSAGTHPAQISSSAGASVQLGYGHQLLSNKSGSLDLDIPLTIAASQNEILGSGFSTRAQTNIFFTPGIRYRFVPESRVSPFVVIGGGVGSFGSAAMNIGPGLQLNADRTTSPVLGFGFGTDIRITQLLSLRGEVRDFVSRPGLGGTEGRHHPVFGIGLGFHFR